ncbi:hypothetical protein HG536_0B00830 [Torulaspora globosa]|uniref:Plasma membrane fusion protein PRM1 n=1 Tax=Torulaspora globosa TaxID=48254 RepID=A0A7G3ZCI6_9SACH|nr:uncharacterized protein HG536_0B00830 [Torulaspora globosa]QLL31222.1 hypothetical protein HG536_0B00830 [Torulaspora globosa]
MLKSYLSLRDRLSQAWLNAYTLALLLAVFKLVFFSSSLRNAINQSETYIVSRCESIDAIYNNGLKNTPHYLGLFGNYLVKEALEQSVKATLKTLSFLVHASEVLLTFSVDLYLGTYACLIVSAIDGSVDVATNATEKIIDLVNSTVSTFANELDDGLDSVSNVIDKIISAASKVESLFKGGNADTVSQNLAKVNLTISSLRDFHIPSSIDDKLQQLSDKTPDFATVKNMTKNLISKPFEEVRSDIDALNTSAIVQNPQMLYVPPLNDVNGTAGICSKNIPSIEKLYGSLDHALMVTTIVCIVLLTLGAVLMLLPAAWSEIRYWNRLKYMEDQFELIAVQEKDHPPDPFRNTEENPSWDLIAAVNACLQYWSFRISRWIISACGAIRSKGEMTNLQKVRIHWVVSYVTSSRALCVLCVGAIGLLVCVLQLVTIAVLRRTLQHEGGSSMEQMLNSTALSFESDINTWCEETNAYINSTEGNMNDQLFGWLQKTTVSVNDTVTKMMSGIDGTLADVFNGTILYSPMNTVVDCVIGNKLTAVEQAMTWIHDNVQFKLPRLNGSDITTVFQQQQKNSANSTTSPTPFSAEDIVSELRSALIKILDSFYNTAIWELTVALVILGIWLSQIPIAIAIVLYRSRRLPTNEEQTKPK